MYETSVPLFRSQFCPQQADFLSLAKTLLTTNAYPDVVAALDKLDDHLAYRTFLVGHSLNIADLAVWGSLKCESTHSAELE